MTVEKKGMQPGGAVDAGGNPVIDPTVNVRALSEASNQRQDDLRQAQDKYMEARFTHLSELSADREANAKEVDDLNVKHIRDIVDINSKHTADLAAAESNRINAVRAVDVAAVNTAYERANVAIATLATTQANAAETLRTQLANTVAQIGERIANLEKLSYIGAGRQAIVDPQLEELIKEMKDARLSGAVNTGKGMGVGVVIAIAVPSIVAMIAIVGFVMKMMGS